MATSSLLCSICELQNISKPPIVWCSECDEALCTDCSNHHQLSKSSRHHTTTPIEDYEKLPADLLKIDQFCKEHDERFILFCKSHDTPCCRICVVQNHKQCQDIFKIEEVVQNVKTSHVFQETEQTLSELAENVNIIKKNRQENIESLKKSKTKILNQIKQFRKRVNEHLDQVEEDIIKELNKIEKTESMKIQKIVKDLEQKEKDINEIHINLSNIKQYASDLQAYLSMKQIQNDVEKTDAAIDSIVNKLKQKVLSLEISTAMKDILTGVNKFGNIFVEEENCVVVTSKKKNQQAQLLLPHLTRTIDTMTLNLQQTLLVDSSVISGCCILPDDRFVFTDKINNRLIFMNADGTRNYTKLSIPSGVHDVIYVKYNNSLAVTSGRYDNTFNNYITFINIKNKKVKDTIKVNSYCYGIAEKDNMLFYCDGSYIYSVSLTDKSITKFKQIPKSDKTLYTNIDIYEDNLYHANSYTDTITCYNLNGEIKWEFKDLNIIKGLEGISVDNRGNVYVACVTSSSVVVISPEGQKCRELLSKKDKLSDPCAIHYDRLNDILLVANDDITAFLYKVT